MSTYCSQNWNLYPDTQAPSIFSLYCDTCLQTLEAIGHLFPWLFHDLESYHLSIFMGQKNKTKLLKKKKRGKLSPHISGLILCSSYHCIVQKLIFGLHCRAGRVTHTLSALYQTGIEPEANSDIQN